MVGIFSVPSKTVKNLAEMLGFSVIYPNKYYNYSFSKIIRWGEASMGFDGEEINKREAIINATKKDKARQIWKDAGLPIPEMGSEKFPCVGRPSTHRGGRRFWYCHDRFDVRAAQKKGATYFSSYYPKTKEYRVHIGSGKLLGIALKEGGDPHSKNWNFKKGFKFRYLHSFEWDREVIRLAKKAIEALGLDFGAVDIASDPIDNTLPHAVILEVNTAPSLFNYSLNKYVEYFKWITEEEYDPYRQEALDRAAWLQQSYLPTQYLNNLFSQDYDLPDW